MENIKSVFIPVQSSASELCKAIAAALATNLGWKLDESNPSCVWDSDAHDLGVELKVNNSSLIVKIKNAVNASTDSSLFVNWGTTGYYLDFVYSANKTAVAFGARVSTTTAIQLCVVFDGNNAIKSTANQMWHSVHRGTSELLSFNVVVNKNSQYTSIILLPSMFGDVFTSVYGIFTCPNVDKAYVYYIGGSYYRVIGTYSTTLMMFKVG